MTANEKINKAIELLQSALAEQQAPSGCPATSFMRAHTRAAPGSKIPFVELYRRFQSGLPGEQIALWRKARFSASLRSAGLTLRNSNHNALFVFGVEWIA